MSEKICPHDDTHLKQIGFDVVEKIKTIPPQSSIVEEKMLKYVCPCCELHVVQAKYLHLYLACLLRNDLKTRQKCAQQHPAHGASFKRETVSFLSGT